MSAPKDVAVTGMGAVSALGHDCSSLLRAIESGVGGIGPIRRFDTSDFSVHTAAEVRDWPSEMDRDEAHAGGALCSAFALRAAREAVAQARLAALPPPPHRIGLVFGTSLGNLDRPIHQLAEELAEQLGLEGPRLTICTACSSSTAAIGLGRDLVLHGTADVVLAGGADVLTPRVFAGFYALGVLTTERCAPFSTPFGTSLGEGAGFLVIEPAVLARKRGVEPLAFLSGYGLSADGHHETTPDPRGRGVERAMLSAIVDAGIGPEDVGYVNAHGSGTEANDPSEWQGIRRVLEGSAKVPVSSCKGALGHTQGAAGALETIATILTMQRKLIPSTLNFVGPRPFGPEDPIAGPMPRAGQYDHAVCLNAAFGGSNVAVVVSRTPSLRAAERRRDVGVVGMGMVSRCGLGVDAWERGGEGCLGGKVPSFSIADVSRRIDPHGLDRSSRYLTAAAALALRDTKAGPSARAGNHAGLVLGSIRPSPESLGAFGRSVDELGLPRVSAPAFARIVLNAPAGFCSKLLGLRGPLTALTVGAGSGLAAILLAAEILSLRDDVCLMLGAAVDEMDDNADPVDAMPAGEGAACVAIAPVGVHDTTFPRIASWAVAGPHRLSDAVERARARAARSVEVDAHFDERHYAGSRGGHWALPSAFAFVAAVSALRRGEAQRALVTSDLGASVSLAVLLDA